jgi:hypothetical protein
LRVRGVQERLADAIRRQPIEQGEAAAHRDLSPRLIDHHESP